MQASVHGGGGTSGVSLATGHLPGRRAPPCHPAASRGRGRRPDALFGRPRRPAAAAPAAGWARGARRGRIWRRAWCRRVDPSVACTWRHAGPARCARRAPGRPFGPFGGRKRPLSKIRAAAAASGVRGRGRDRKPRLRAFYRYPWRAPPTSPAGAVACAAVLGGAPPGGGSDVFGPPRGAVSGGVRARYTVRELF